MISSEGKYFVCIKKKNIYKEKDDSCINIILPSLGKEHIDNHTATVMLLLMLQLHL